MKAINRDGTIFVQLPPRLREPINWGCQCTYCKAHPDQTPAWDAIAVDMEVGSAWTVHYPEL